MNTMPSEETQNVVVTDQMIEDFYDQAEFKIFKQCQNIMGLWPYKGGYARLIKRIIVYLFLCSSHFPFINACIIWCGKNAALCSENIVGVLYLNGLLLKYIVTIFCENKLKNVYFRLTQNWYTVTVKQEKEMIVKYFKMTKLKTKLYLGYMACAGIGFSQLPMFPIVMDVILPLNKSRERILIVRAEFAIDPIKYYYLIYAYFTFLAFIVIVTLVGMDSMYMIVTHQTMAIFRIVRYRLMEATKLVNVENNLDYKLIIRAICLHHEALDVIDSLEESYSALFLVIIAYTIGFCSLFAIVFWRFLGDVLDGIRMFLVLIGVVIHLLYFTLPGQMILDHSEDLFIYSYQNEWYTISTRGKTLLKIIQLRCIKPCVLTAGGLYIINFQNCGAIFKTIMSYVTAAISLRS